MPLPPDRTLAIATGSRVPRPGARGRPARRPRGPGERAHARRPRDGRRSPARASRAPGSVHRAGRPLPLPVPRTRWSSPDAPP